MKTRKHGKGLNHDAVVKFSNRLARIAVASCPDYLTTECGKSFDAGYRAACKYFAHQLRKVLRNFEKYGL